jgi:CheY-like chemotaxis protein
MQMPELDGYAAAKILRQRGCTLPIVALTASAMPEDHQRCLDAGCDTYAPKPLERTRLYDLCTRALSLRPKPQSEPTPT